MESSCDMDKNDMFLFAPAWPCCCACCHGCSSGCCPTAEALRLLRRELCSDEELAAPPGPPPRLSGDMTRDGGKCRSCSCSEEGRSSCEDSELEREREGAYCPAPLCAAAAAATGLAAAPFAAAAELAPAMLGLTRSRTGLARALAAALVPVARRAASGWAGVMFVDGGAAAMVRAGCCCGGGCCVRRLIAEWSGVSPRRAERAERQRVGQRRRTRRHGSCRERAPAGDPRIKPINTAHRERRRRPPRIAHRGDARPSFRLILDDFAAQDAERIRTLYGVDIQAMDSKCRVHVRNTHTCF